MAIGPHQGVGCANPAKCMAGPCKTAPVHSSKCMQICSNSRPASTSARLGCENRPRRRASTSSRPRCVAGAVQIGPTQDSAERANRPLGQWTTFCDFAFYSCNLSGPSPQPRSPIPSPTHPSSPSLTLGDTRTFLAPDPCAYIKSAQSSEQTSDQSNISPWCGWSGPS